MWELGERLLKNPDVGYVAVLLLVPLFAGTIGWGTLQAYRLLPQGQGAWRKTRRDLGYFPLVLAALILLLLVARSLLPQVQAAQVVELLVPMFIGLQSALLISPDDEPLFEIILTTRRPLIWLLVERIIVLFAVQGAIAFAGSLLTQFITGESLNIFATVLRWLPPSILLSGLAISFTLMTRQPALSMAMVGICWAFMFFSGAAMVGLMPALWPIQLFPAPGTEGFLFNRLLITLLGLAFMVRAASALNDEESLLLKARTN
jgi:hypothetical protein